jgi:2-keto-4-pentenoate hydratase
MDSMFLPEGTPVPPVRFLQPRVEPELAFVLRTPLRGPDLTTADVVRAVDHVRPALEIVDSRIRDWNLSIVDTVADNASSGGVVLGATRFTVGDLAPATVRCSMWRNGTDLRQGTGREVLGDPLRAVAWLANAVARHGVSIEAGQTVLSGSMTATVPVYPGDTVEADFGAAGRVTLAIAG